MTCRGFPFLIHFVFVWLSSINLKRLSNRIGDCPVILKSYVELRHVKGGKIIHRILLKKKKKKKEQTVKYALHELIRPSHGH